MVLSPEESMKHQNNIGPLLYYVLSICQGISLTEVDGSKSAHYSQNPHAFTRSHTHSLQATYSSSHLLHTYNPPLKTHRKQTETDTHTHTHTHTHTQNRKHTHRCNSEMLFCTLFTVVTYEWSLTGEKELISSWL